MIVMGLLLGLPAIFATTISTFNNGVGSENLTFTTNENITRYVDVPVHVYVDNASLIMEGYHNNISDCYQENATTKTYCSVNYSSVYSVESLAFYVNYTIPNGTKNIKWQVKHGYDGANPLLYNISSSENTNLSECLDANNSGILQLRINSTFIIGYAGSSPQCYNSSQWVNVGNLSNITSVAGGSMTGIKPSHVHDGNYSSGVSSEFGGGTSWQRCTSGICFYSMVYEEGIYWNLSSYPVSPYLEIGTLNGNYEWNHSAEFNEIYFANFSSKLNTILNGECSCEGCANVSGDCRIPFTFHSDGLGNLSLSYLDIEYIVSLNISIFDETTDGIISGPIIDLEIISNDNAQNHSTTTGYININISPNIEYRIKYESVDYGARDYWVESSDIVGGEYMPIDLYLLSDTNGTDVTFTIQDNSGNDISSATVWLKRYYVSTNSYRTVAMARTNEEGEVVIDVDFNDAFYQILVTYGDYSLQTIGARIISTTLILTLDLTPDIFSHMNIVDGITTSLTFNNLTKTFSYSFTDTGGTARRGLLEVHRGNYLECSNIATSASATLLCQVNTTNVTGRYTAKGYIQIGSYSQNALMQMLEILTGFAVELKDQWGAQGIFFAILISGSLAGLGVMISPAVGVIMFLVGIFITSFFGMTILPAAMIGFFILIGAIMVYKMKK